MLQMWLDPGAPPQLAGLHTTYRLPTGTLTVYRALKLIRAGCGTRFRGMRSLTFAACGNKTLFSIIFTTSPLAKSWIRACIHRSIYCHNLEISVQQLQLDANLFFVEVVSGKSPSHSIYHQIEWVLFFFEVAQVHPRRQLLLC